MSDESLNYTPENLEGKEKDLKWIEGVLPHREEALLLTRVLECDPGKTAVAEYDIPPDFFGCKGHFPNKPVVPGHYLQEMGSLASAVVLLTLPEYQGRTPYAGETRFIPKWVVRPGETVRIKAEAIKSELEGKRKRWFGKYQIFVKERIVGEGEIQCVI